jgi:4-carboxymuconolactone decarboxylase
MTMNITDKAKVYFHKVLKTDHFITSVTDPELSENYINFTFDESVSENDLDLRTRGLCALASSIGANEVEYFKYVIGAAFNMGVKPVEIREVVYQSLPYCGAGRTRKFTLAMNAVFDEKDIELPLPPQSTTTRATRLKKGNETQIKIFGERSREAWKRASPGMEHIAKWLAANCFGDFYTRGALNLKEREMITFCFLAAMGGCEPQLISHATGNMNIGNDRHFLIQVVSYCVPFIGYPRSLNAFSAIEEAVKLRKPPLAP